MFSTRRSARSRSVTWNAIPSRALAPPATSPVHAARSMRPFETRSSVAHWYAKTSGSRTGNDAMQPAPSLTRRVAAASAPSSAIESGRGLAPRLSPTQTNPDEPEERVGVGARRQGQHLGHSRDAEEDAALREREADGHALDSTAQRPAMSSREIRIFWTSLVPS